MSRDFAIVNLVMVNINIKFLNILPQPSQSPPSPHPRKDAACRAVPLAASHLRTPRRPGPPLARRSSGSTPLAWSACLRRTVCRTRTQL